MTYKLLSMEFEQWEKIGLGDKEAYSEMYVFYYKKLYNYGRKFTDDIAMIEDAINEVFITIWARRENLNTINSPNNYLFTSFRNNIFKKIKTARILQLGEVFSDSEVDFSIDNFIIKKEVDKAMGQQLQNAFNRITARQREAIFLRFYEQLSFPEVALIMGISVKATYKIISRALDELRKILSLEVFFFLALLNDVLS